tara:strand:+ start:6408 stop:7535 length:1128 start_codon:yes stop_codon:yes gene_type:complete
MNFENFSPTNIIFGNGSINNINKLAQGYGKKCLIVTGKNSIQKYGYLDIIKKNLDKKIFVYNNISPDVKSDEVNLAIEICKNKKIDFIIALGGGSTIDASKSISLYKSLNKIDKVIGTNLNSNILSVPVIAIPTTAGTGSEVTKGAIITNSKSYFKSGVRGNQIFPKVAIIDPSLTLTLPQNVAVETGFDTFTHLFESYLANRSNIFTEALSIYGLGIILKELPKSLKNPKDLDLRSKVMFCSLLGGLNVANASTCLPHRLQQAMTDKNFKYKYSHAKGLSLVYPSWLKRVYPHSKLKITNLKKKLNIISSKYDFIIEFMEKIKIKNKKKIKIEEKIINNFANNISGNLENDPMKKISKKVIKEIYKETFNGKKS